MYHFFNSAVQFCNHCIFGLSCQKSYITSNRYDKKILHGTLSSKAPITDEKIVSEFEKYGINCRVERYHETTLELYSEKAV